MSVLYINGDDTKNSMHGWCVVLLILFIVHILYELERSCVNILKISASLYSILAEGMQFSISYYDYQKH